MILSELKQHLANTERPQFFLPNGSKVPAHYHLTEIGVVTKDFIDCGNTRRTERSISLQLWTSVDLHHRLSSDKLIKIIGQFEKNWPDSDLIVNVEYQGAQTKEIYELHWNDQNQSFHLGNTKTACLATDQCGIEGVLNFVSSKVACCSPEKGCC